MLSLGQGALKRSERHETLWKRPFSTFTAHDREARAWRGDGGISTAGKAIFYFRRHLCRSLLVHSFEYVLPAEQIYTPLPSAFTFIMIASFSLLLSSVALSFASPLGPIEVRTVAALNTAAFEEAQQRDATATRAFSGIEIIVCFSTCAKDPC